ncbi:lysosomal Pro-X carboxypeptidase [Eucalyptus grandis]|uniref:lysosomal Pro-X carboxypeptidase n=1 Tax=Eucalyptus grandis TaxID=71139 RepID=UPI00192EB3CC|nr:lysosomal Pro-X carboxypeptidase [Eucalyptus grandis]
MITNPGMSSHRRLWIALLLLSASVATAHVLDDVDIPKLGMSRPEFLLDPARAVQASVAEDSVTFFYNQTLDHFNYGPESYTAFNQRYVVNSKYWGGADSGAPIFAFFGAEAPIDGDIANVGFLTDNAAQFRALLVYIEHRFYGKSIPYGMTIKKALGDPNIRGYFSSAQALADYAEILLHLKQKLKAEHSPIIVLGGSYGGMLASWFRLKYPHVALGALASSAPILYFDDIIPQDAYYSVVAKSFLESSSSCHETIRRSWEEIDRVASEPRGLTKLSNTFKTCSPLQSSSELKKYLRFLYAQVVQYNDPSTQPLKLMCDAVNGVPPRKGLLQKIFAGLVAINGNLTCYVNAPPSGTFAQTLLGWSWQTCTEMVIPMGITRNTMFPPKPFNLNSFSNACKSVFGVPPRPHWVTTYFGGHDIKLILHRFASNIIFSNGLQDPYSSGGVLKNISSTVVAIYTAKGSHTLDILGADKSDPDWLVEQRKTEVKIMKKWLAKYYADLRAFGN